LLPWCEDLSSKDTVLSLAIAVTCTNDGLVNDIDYGGFWRKSPLILRWTFPVNWC